MGIVYADYEPGPPKQPTFIDLFAGCGGLSLGLMLAGWQGLFAVERDPDAFATLRENLLVGPSRQARYQWPQWLPQEPHDIVRFNRQYHDRLRKLNGKVDLIAGGPPCQGFSFAGRRRGDDHRNQLIRHYLHVVSLVRPKFLLVENVEGIAIEFGRKWRDKDSSPTKSFAERIHRALQDRLHYRVYSGIVRAADFGVPQTRPRFIMLGIREDLVTEDSLLSENPFGFLQDLRLHFLAEKGLPVDRAVTAAEALSDLETSGKRRIPCADSRGYEEAVYVAPRTAYQKLLHGELGGAAPNSMRLVNHRPETIKRFARALLLARKGVTLSKPEKHRLGIMKKHQFKILDRDKPSLTLTTLPDDMLHYSEPRILTVRESARLQSFPDWFRFKGKYTTGGALRVKEAPRYTQVGNAVPPFMAEALGVLLLGYHTELSASSAASADRELCHHAEERLEAALA